MTHHTLRRSRASTYSKTATVLTALTLAVGFASPSDADDRCQAEANAPKAGRQADAGTEQSQKLADCRGVLSPPSVGDGEMVSPPPQKGSMPVIKPDNTPPQQPGNGSAAPAE